MKPTAFLLAALLAAVSIPGISMAAEVSTDPVGVVRLSVPAQTDSRLAIPLIRAAAFTGLVTAVNGNELTLSGAAFTTNQFVKNGTAQPDAYFVRVATGTAAGAWFTITANSATSVTVSPPSSQTLSDSGLVAGTGISKVIISPHWSLKTLFPNGAGVVASTNPFAPLGTLLLFNNPALTGINIPPAITYCYHDGSSGFLAAGWYDIGNLFGGQVGDIPLAPDEQVVVRNQSATLLNLAVTGAIPNTKVGTELLELTKAHDNPVVQPFPVSVSPTQLQLVESGAFKPSKNVFAPDGDLLLQFTVPATGYNQAPSKSYMYYDGSAGFVPAGWYDIGNVFGGAVTNTVLFTPGEALIIRKNAGTEKLVPWSAGLPYSL